jgi:predicted alpha/beta hydrolase
MSHRQREWHSLTMPYLTTNGIRLSYERSGRGESVLLVMGSGAAGRVWTVHQTPALNQAGYEIVTFDHRGISPSDVPPGKYTLEEMVTDTAELIKGKIRHPALGRLDRGFDILDLKPLTEEHPMARAPADFSGAAHLDSESTTPT